MLHRGSRTVRVLPTLLKMTTTLSLLVGMSRSFSTTRTLYSSRGFASRLIQRHRTISMRALCGRCPGDHPYPRCLQQYLQLQSARDTSVCHRSALTRLFSTSQASDSDIDNSFFATPSFEELGIQSPVLLTRLQNMGYEKPTQVQASTFAKIRATTVASDDNDDGNHDNQSTRAADVTIGAETGSGKTLAYLLPLIDDILQSKQQGSPSYDYARAIILVPNKELVQQVLRMAAPLCGGTSRNRNDVVIWGGGDMPIDAGAKAADGGAEANDLVRIAVMPGGLAEPLDFKPFRDSIQGDAAPADLIIATPAAVGPFALKPKNIEMFADIQTLIIDEADMLLDGGYIRQLENVLMGFRRADRLSNAADFGGTDDDGFAPPPKTQHIFCAATLPDMGLRSVDAYLQKKFPRAERIQMSSMHNARHYGLVQPTVWVQEESKKERMEKLVELLGDDPEMGGLKGEKVMVFLNSVDDVEGAHGALERAGIPSVRYHAKIPLAERSQSLDQFRLYDPEAEDHGKTKPVLVCTDLASRGLDVPGVNVVVQLQFAGNVVAHLHRMGRCGRAGQRTGRGIVFYNEQESELVDVVREAETQQERMVLEGDVQEIDVEGKAGTVQKAFSRKRGFTKKRKKIRREAE